MIGLWDDASSEVFGPMSNAKRKNILVYYRILLLFETVWFLGLQSRDQASMLVNKWFFFSQRSSQNLYKNIITFLAEGETFVLAHLHGRREVSYKPAIQQTSHLQGSISGTCRVRQGLPPWLRLDTRFGFCAWRLHIIFKPRVFCGLVVLQYDI